MTREWVETQSWPWRRWGGTVVLIFIVQLALIFWLGSRSPISPRPPTPALILRLGGLASSDLQALNDPTLFILPHQEGFPDSAWRSLPPFRLSAFRTNFLLLTSDHLGTAFNLSLETNGLPAFQPSAQFPTPPTLPAVSPPALLADQSVAELQDGLALHRLLALPNLRSCTNSDILASTVLRVGVDDGGRPVSVILFSSSGSPVADQLAVEQAWAARFDSVSSNSAASVPHPSGHLSWGRMVFRWHTVSTPLAALPAAAPPTP